MVEGCIFCRIASGELKTDFLYEDDRLMAFNDINPQAPTHVLIVPRAHIATLNDLGEEEWSLIGAMAGRARAIARARGIDQAGYRLVMNCNAEGGQTVFHIHLHLLGGRPLAHLG